MIVVLAIDALEYEKVEEYNCIHLKQRCYGKTDISEFSQPRTMVLWSSFMTGENKEEEVLSKGNKEMWNIKWDIEETFFSSFSNPVILDLPGFNYDKEVHDRSRELLKRFFEEKSQGEKKKIRDEYNKLAFDHHRIIKEEFLNALEREHDFVLGYFSVADVIGHLNFGNNTMMKLIYQDLDEIATKAADKTDKLIVLSDHGMEAIGEFGDHSNYGFWSTSWGSNLKKPRITDFRDVILALKEVDTC
ncbi:MAG TPA: hypothetical protein ENG12_05745 [Candidatus Altiarchaeales archaeon]|nr:hypothetical protein [Candidatus Altiarchaeales archaeon]